MILKKNMSLVSLFLIPQCVHLYCSVWVGMRVYECMCCVYVHIFFYIDHSVGVDDSEDDSLPEEKTCQSLTNSPTKGRVVLRQKSDVSDRIPRTTSVRRRSASFKKVQKYKRQEAREEKVCVYYLDWFHLPTHSSFFPTQRSKFIPPYGKPTNLRVSNLQRTPEVIDMLLQKYNVRLY